LGIPLQTLTATYRGVSEAAQRFRGISLTRMALGVANFAAPLAVVQHTSNLAALVLALLLARALACVAFRHLALRSVPLANDAPPLSKAERLTLMRDGGWFSVSAVVSPLMSHADRFVIGAMLSATAVSTYAVPFDVVTQLLVIVTAVSTVAFPSISRQLQADVSSARTQFKRWLLTAVAVMAAVTAVVAWWLPALLGAWIGDKLPDEASSIGRWLCLGVWINSIGSMCFAWLHAHGRYRATAMLHLLELPFYFGILWLMLAHHGVVGAAMAWVLRVAVDTLVLAWMARDSSTAGARTT
jgi:O-antigen/teichoic acid export membrane protein